MKPPIPLPKAKRPAQDGRAITVTIPDELYQFILWIARAEQRSVAWVARRSLIEWHTGKLLAQLKNDSPIP